MSSKTKKPSERRCYDVDMIRDFLAHLLWEVRIGHYELTNPSAKTNPELGEQLQKFIKKRQTVGLNFAHAFGGDVPPEDVTRFRDAKAALRESQVRNLEALHSLFVEAFVCASHPKEFVVRAVDDVDAEIRRMSGGLDEE